MPDNSRVIGDIPDAYVNTTQNNGPTISGEFFGSSSTNRLRCQYDATASAVGAGTTPISTLVKSFRLYRGTKDAHETNPIIEVTENSLDYAAVFTAKRDKRPGAASVQRVLDQVMAVGATQYFGFGDIVNDLLPGNFYWEVEVNPITVLGVPAATTLTFDFIVIPINDGSAVRQAFALRVGSQNAITTGFVLNGVSDFGLANSGTELSGVISGLTGDQKYTTAGVQFLEDIADSALVGSFAASAAVGPGANFLRPIQDPANTANALYVLMKSCVQPTTWTIKISAQTTLKYMNSAPVS